MGWLEILNLAERLGSGPSLVPPDIDDRMLMVGLSNELIGENGFIWSLRLLMLGLGGPERAAGERLRNPMYDQYGYSEEAAALAVDRAKTVVDRLTVQLLAQREAGRRYIVGETLSAVDIYWVYFSQAVRTFSEAVCPDAGGYAARLRNGWEQARGGGPHPRRATRLDPCRAQPSAGFLIVGSERLVRVRAAMSLAVRSSGGLDRGGPKGASTTRRQLKPSTPGGEPGGRPALFRRTGHEPRLTLAPCAATLAHFRTLNIHGSKKGRGRQATHRRPLVGDQHHRAVTGQSAEGGG